MSLLVFPQMAEIRHMDTAHRSRLAGGMNSGLLRHFLMSVSGAFALFGAGTCTLALMIMRVRPRRLRHLDWM
ncbi:hypothetical protein A9K76_08570 [Stenotrophomonas maltophilia]|nr:hypothetical protein A9K76_08570 [Stenotrophomonas maltophilia]